MHRYTNSLMMIVVLFNKIYPLPVRRSHIVSFRQMHITFPFNNQHISTPAYEDGALVINRCYNCCNGVLDERKTESRDYKSTENIL